MPHKRHLTQSHEPIDHSVAGNASSKGHSKPAVNHTGIPDHAKPAQLQTQANGSPTIIQRQKIIVGQKVVHINDYHFLNRFKYAKAPASGTHDVIISGFSDFEGLAAEAAKYDQATFEFDGFKWGWSNANEIWPIEDGVRCVKLSTDQIAQLIYFAQNEGTPHKDLSQNKLAKAALTSLQSGAGKKQQDDLQALTLPLTITIKALPKSIKFEAGTYYSKSLTEGGDSVEAFLLGPHGDKKEGPHLHIFFKCKPVGKGDEMDRPLTITGYHCTTSKKQHLRVIAGQTVDKDKGNPVTLKSTEPQEMEEMLAMIGSLNRMTVTAGNEGSKSKKEVETKVEIPVWEKKSQHKENKDFNIKKLAERYAVREKVMEGLLVKIVMLGPEDIATVAESPDRAEEVGISILELKLLSSLDSAAKTQHKSEEEIIDLLESNGYPTDPVQMQTYYDGLITSLQ